MKMRNCGRVSLLLTLFLIVPQQAAATTALYSLSYGARSAGMAGAEALLPPLLKHVHALLADKAYDAQARVIDPLEKAEVTVVIPPKANRLQPRPYDQHLTQAISRSCHPLRQTRRQLPRSCPPGRFDYPP